MRLVILIIGLFLSTLLPGWLIFLLAGAYALKWFAYDLVLVGLLIDGFFGVADWPVYTFYAVLIVFLIEWIRPKMMLYNEF